MKTRRFWGAAAGALALLAAAATADACTRAVYLGRDGLVITGRTMDWKEEIGTNLYLFPRGMERAGYDRDTALRWRAKYGSVVASAYDFDTCDGMNEAGLVASLLFLPESDYGKQGKRPVMGIAMWTQYVLDNFGTVSEAVGALRGDGIYIDAPDMPNGTKSRLHLAISDATGDSAILEYIDGRLRIHEGRQYRVMTNSPRYDLQLAVNDYWEAIGGLKMLPGTNRSSDRFARASFYIGVIPQTADAAVGVPAVLSVMRNVSVPFGISTPDQPHISSTRWRSVCDQKNKVYYFEGTMVPSLFWVDLSRVDLSEGAPARRLMLTGGEMYAGDATSRFVVSEPFEFLYRLPKP